MNWLDFVIIGLLALFVFLGFRRGFIKSVLSVAAGVLSWVAAAVFYQPLAKLLAGKQEVYDTFLYLSSEVVDKVGDAGVLNAPVSSFSPEGILQTLQSANIPQAIKTAVQENVLTKAFEDKNLLTVGDYLKQTVADMALNAACFVGLLIVAYILCRVIISIMDHVFQLPILRTFNGWLGALLGFAGGVFLLYLLFSVAPLLTSVLPIKELDTAIEQSALASFLIRTNFFVLFFKGKI